MKKGRVHLIRNVVQYLQPVAREHIGERKKTRVIVGFEGVVLREGRHVFGRPHVREHQPIALESWIGALTQRLAQARSLVALTRRLQERTVDIEMKSVVGASDSALLDHTELQRCATVAAVLVQNADTAGSVPKRNEVLVEYANRVRNVGQSRGHAHGLPESAHVLPEDRSGPSARKLEVR